MRQQAGGWVLGAWLALAAGNALAADLEVRVADDRGQPVADAVVTLWPAAGTQAAPDTPPPRRHTIDQQNLAFVPYLEVFRPGDEVVFHNSDNTRHHVYSFSPARRFDFVLAPREDSRPQRLETTGVIAVGCNIHDGMVAYLYVSAAPWLVRTDARGHAVFRDLPPARYQARAWQPRLRPGRPEPVQPVNLEDAGTARLLKFTLTLLPDPRRRFDREHMHY